MDEQAAVRFLTNLLGIYSPSGKEQDIANFLALEMKRMGFEVGIDMIGNVIGVVGEGEPVILLCGHMDTVAGHMPLRIEEGKIYARGAVDAKGPLASMVMAALEASKEPNFKGKILVASVVEEEATSKGVRHLITQGIKADYAIFGEPSGVENITIGYKGQIQLKIVVKTETGHSSTPWLYDNALEKAYQLWETIKAACTYPSIEPQETPFTAITACLVRMIGGRGNSVIPFEAEMNLDVRVPIQFTTTQVYDKMMKIIANYQKVHPNVNVKASVLDTVEPFEANKSLPLVHVMSSAVRKVLNQPATLLRKTGTGDMNILGNSMNLPIVTYGPGDSHLDHTLDEHIKISDYLNAIQIYKETIIKISELHNSKAGIK
ncbi:MAG: M20/M25/M40 family metallo-hydrolase [Candidatus Bathyarchaeota archaeon]|nr:M20/M25/M40 family metallo-hydrolase [Candidatus Bathyarchaeota archaeon]MDD4324876.1 M20/M25/M40 family metallo-hydrolase [Candidatus Bathyarchaeota archaeon]MDI9577487.1 M20/M25/M40 family metallo-hydrolase [Thermoproteota archaeon]NLD65819.1 M20/M25/M40 family metallo-hydrolase [Thermoproteota archaeon]